MLAWYSKISWIENKKKSFATIIEVISCSISHLLAKISLLFASSLFKNKVFYHVRLSAYVTNITTNGLQDTFTQKDVYKIHYTNT